MGISERILKNNERAIYSLRALYKDYGYSHFKVSKFEEYDLYAHNKSFLVSNNILTFTDTNGKLLALKPDVTLSIIKNISDKDECIHKLCYNETVYRTSADSDGFREIMQTGLECIGDIDSYSEYDRQCRMLEMIYQYDQQCRAAAERGGAINDLFAIPAREGIGRAKTVPADEYKAAYAKLAEDMEDQINAVAEKGGDLF